MPKTAKRNGSKTGFYSDKFTAQAYWDNETDRTTVKMAAVKSGKSLAQYIADSSLAAAKKDLKS